MSDQAFPQTHSTVTHSSVQAAPAITRPYLDFLYIRTTHGLLKIAESVLDFICFICVVCGPRPSIGGASWAEFVTIVSFIVTVVLFIMYLFHMIEILSIVPWLLVEMVYCALWALFYLIAGSILSAHSAQFSANLVVGAWIAAAFFSFILMALYAFDCFYKFRCWRNEEPPQGVAAKTPGSVRA